MKHIGTRMLHAYWNSLRGARRVPERRDIDPMQIASLLPDIALLDLDDLSGLQVRLAGTRVCDLFGMELRGMSFVDLWDDASGEDLATLAQTVVEESAVAVMAVRGHGRGARFMHFEGIMMPLAGSDAAAGHVLLGLHTPSRPAWFGTEPLLALGLSGHRMSWPTGRIQSSGSSGFELPVLAHEGARQVGRFMVYEGGQAGLRARA